MKKKYLRPMTMLLAVLLALGTMSVALATSSTAQKELASGITTFTYTLDIDPINYAYASLQFDIKINNDALSGLDINSITYTSDFNKASAVPPARKVNGFDISYQAGFLQADFTTGKNQFSNTGTKTLCTISFNYSGSTDATVTFDQLKVWRLEDAGNNSMKINEYPIDSWSRTVTVSRSITTTPGAPGTPSGGGGQNVLGATTIDFNDVHEGDWYFNAVEYVVAANMFSGTSATMFEPGTPLTRGMFVTIIHRLAGKPAVTGANPFTDVESGAWYTDAVLWAAKAGIVKGYTGDTFGPSDVLTREQLVTMLYRYASFKGYNTAGLNEELQMMTDTNKISSYAVLAFKWAYAADIIHGTTPTTLSPLTVATRAEGAKMIMDFMESFVTKI